MQLFWTFQIWVGSVASSSTIQAPAFPSTWTLPLSPLCQCKSSPAVSSSKESHSPALAAVATVEGHTKPPSLDMPSLSVQGHMLPLLSRESHCLSRFRWCSLQPNSNYWKFYLCKLFLNSFPTDGVVWLNQKFSNIGPLRLAESALKIPARQRPILRQKLRQMSIVFPRREHWGDKRSQRT